MANHAPGAPSALIPVLTGHIAGIPQQLCNARDLHQFLRVAKDFSDWIKYRIEQYGFREDEDFILRSPNLGSKRRGGQNRTDYLLSLDMAKELAMVENNDQGRSARRYFIECERKAHTAPAPALPTPPAPPPGGRQLPPPIDPVTPELLNAIVRKAHALALDGMGTLAARLERELRARAAYSTPAQLAEWLDQVDGRGVGLVLLAAEELATLCGMVRTAEIGLAAAMRAIRDIEARTGREWYGRGGQ